MADRRLGDKEPLSIGTAIPFEERITNGDKVAADNLWINVRTLFRNFMGAYDTPVPVQSVMTEFFNELFAIDGVCRQFGVNLQLYYPSYRTFSRLHRGAIVKDKLTVRQRMEASNMRVAMLSLMASELVTQLSIGETDTELPGTRGTTWIITHEPVDLLSRNRFSDLVLLESHTGTLKTPDTWINKLLRNKKTEHLYQHLPFNPFTYRLLGDNTLCESHKTSLKKAVLELSLRKRWTHVTSMSEIKNDLYSISDREMRDTLKRLI